MIYEYQYDNEMRLDRISYYSGNDPDESYQYELFEYNTNDEIETRLVYSYANDSIGWVLTDSTYYRYENGNLIHEVTYHPPPNIPCMSRLI